MRSRLSISQKDFGQRIGLGADAISNIEAGRRVPRLDSYLLMSEVYGWSLPWLLFEYGAVGDKYAVVAPGRTPWNDDTTEHLPLIDITLAAIVDRVRLSRLLQGYSQVEACRLAGLHPNTLALWEVNATAGPRLDKLIAYATGLRVSPVWLVLGVGVIRQEMVR